MGRLSSWWLNQPIWKILTSQSGSFPQIGVNIKNIWVATTLQYFGLSFFLIPRCLLHRGGFSASPYIKTASSHGFCRIGFAKGHDARNKNPNIFPKWWWNMVIYYGAIRKKPGGEKWWFNLLWYNPPKKHKQKTHIQAYSGSSSNFCV